MHVREKCILAPTGKETSMQQNQKRNCKTYGSGSNQSTSTLVDNNERQCAVPPNSMLFMEIAIILQVAQKLRTVTHRKVSSERRRAVSIVLEEIVQANSLRETQMLLTHMYVCIICHIKYVYKLL